MNILKGDMSFVGPRPERPEIEKMYVEKLPEFSLRLNVKAGLTGYAQVFGKYNSTPEERGFFLDIFRHMWYKPVFDSLWIKKADNPCKCGVYRLYLKIKKLYVEAISKIFLLFHLILLACNGACPDSEMSVQSARPEHGFHYKEPYILHRVYL